MHDLTATLKETCVGFKRAVYNINKDTQDFVFDYQAIHDNKGFCVLEDQLFDATSPCYDLEEEVQTKRRRLMKGDDNGVDIDSERNERRRPQRDPSGGSFLLLERYSSTPCHAKAVSSSTNPNPNLNPNPS